MDIPDIHLRVIYDFEYETKDKRKIQIVRGEKLFLLSKTNSDWWHVIRNSSERPFYVPASYVTEVSKYKTASNDRKRHSYSESLLQNLPGDSSNIPVPELGLKRKTSIFDPKSSSSHPVTESDSNAKLVIPHSVPYIDDVLTNLPFQEGIGDQSNDIQCSEKFIEKSKEHDSCHNREIPNNVVPCTIKRNKTPEFEKSSWSDCSDLGISSRCKSEERCLAVDQPEFGVEKDKIKKTSSNSLEKLLQKFKLISSHKPKETTTSQCDPLDRDLYEPSRSFCGDREMGTYPRGLHSLGKSKLSYSRSFETRREVKDISSRKHRKTHLSSSWEAESRQSTESLDEYLDEDGVSDSGTSLKSSELLDVCDSTNSNPLHDDATCSSCDDAGCYVPVPTGWRKSYDEVSGEQCYINEVSQAKWFSSTDNEGRVYFFPENSVESSWTLPKISIDDSEISPNKPLSEVNDPLLRIKEGEKRGSSRISKARSLLVTDKKQRESSEKSSSIPKNFLLDQSPVLMEGPLNRTKITENGKKVRKNWVIGHVVLREQFLIFYKDTKSVQPELFVELNEAVLEAGDKMSKRKNVFLISTAGLQVLCQADDAQLACEWCLAINNALENLDKSSSKFLAPHSQDVEKNRSPLLRTKSVRSKCTDGSIEDASGNEEQTKIRNRLKRFFHLRPTRETLASKGIYKDEPVFDNHLGKVCSSEPPRIPKFVQLCIKVIEGKEENMKTDGLYRASGNLSHVQKIRLEVDQNNLQVLEKEEDVHVLTGALKLFFRELKEPLLPFELFSTALETGDLNSNRKANIRFFQSVVQQLPEPNRDTLSFLLRHLRKVTEFAEFNRMHVQNLAIVFGPTLIWREKECHQNMALEYMQQNLVIDFFLHHYDEIFKNFKLPNS